MKPQPEKTATSVTALPAQRMSLVQKFAARYSLEPEKLLTTLKATAFKVKDGEATNEQMAALLVVADQYGLNPFTREIFAFPDKQNGIVPVVGVDGWSRIINDHPQSDGFEFRESTESVNMPDAKPCPEWMEVVIHRKDREHPIVVREYLDEVYRPLGTYTDGKKHKPGPWQTHTKRFLRHKTLIQGARIAYGFGGIYDEDEAGRIIEAEVVSTTVARPQAKTEKVAEHSPAASGAAAPQQQAAAEEDGAVLSPGQQQIMRARLESANISDEQLKKQFGATLDAIPAGKFNDLAAWVREMAEANA